ncbi:ionotropic receptor 93a-like [Amblyomma americanum]
MVFLAIMLSLPSYGGKSRLGMFGDYLMDLIGNMLFESTPEPPETSYGRWLTAFWWIVVMVVMTGFTGIMKASMMVKDQTGRLNTIKDVIARPDIMPFVISGSTYERLFKTSNRPDYQRLWRQVQRHRTVTTANQILSKPTFDMLLDEKAIFFCDDILLYWTIARVYPQGFDGEFYMGTDFFINNEFTMFVRRTLDKNIIKQIHQRLRWLWEAGLPQDWNRRAMESALRHTAGAQSAVTASNMKLTDVGAIFYLMLIGQGFACIAALAEVMVGTLLPAASRAMAQRSGRWGNGAISALQVSVVASGQRLSAVGGGSRGAVTINGRPVN